MFSETLRYLNFHRKIRSSAKKKKEVTDPGNGTWVKAPHVIDTIPKTNYFYDKILGSELDTYICV